jgi:hypothetical protein
MTYLESPICTLSPRLGTFRLCRLTTTRCSQRMHEPAIETVSNARDNSSPVWYESMDYDAAVSSFSCSFKASFQPTQNSLIDVVVAATRVMCPYTFPHCFITVYQSHFAENPESLRRGARWKASLTARLKTGHSNRRLDALLTSLAGAKVPGTREVVNTSISTE